MTIETLTEDERECLLHLAGGGVAEKALRVIDAANARADAAERDIVALMAGSLVERAESESAQMRAEVDMLTGHKESLLAQVRMLQAGAKHLNGLLVSAESESAALRAEVERVKEQERNAGKLAVMHAEGRWAAESRLAAANALLAVNMPMASADEAEDWTEAVVAYNDGDMAAVRAYLAAQPVTAPYVQPRGKAGQVVGMSESFEYVGSPSSPLPPAFEAANRARTEADHVSAISQHPRNCTCPKHEAEQRVLDAMSEWPEQDLRDPLDAPPASQRQHAWRCLIELCRAELARRGLK